MVVEQMNIRSNVKRALNDLQITDSSEIDDDVIEILQGTRWMGPTRINELKEELIRINTIDINIDPVEEKEDTVEVEEEDFSTSEEMDKFSTEMFANYIVEQIIDIIEKDLGRRADTYSNTNSEKVDVYTTSTGIIYIEESFAKGRFNKFRAGYVEREELFAALDKVAELGFMAYNENTNSLGELHKFCFSRYRFLSMNKNWMKIDIEKLENYTNRNINVYSRKKEIPVEDHKVSPELKKKLDAAPTFKMSELEEMCSQPTYEPFILKYEKLEGSIAAEVKIYKIIEATNCSCRKEEWGTGICLLVGNKGRWLNLDLKENIDSREKDLLKDKIRSQIK